MYGLEIDQWIEDTVIVGIQPNPNIVQARLPCVVNRIRDRIQPDKISDGTPCAHRINGRGGGRRRLLVARHRGRVYDPCLVHGIVGRDPIGDRHRLTRGQREAVILTDESGRNPTEQVRIGATWNVVLGHNNRKFVGSDRDVVGIEEFAGSVSR